MNVELLEKVKQHILAEPKRLDMDYILEPSAYARCGTAGCIAGWAMQLSGVQKDKSLIWSGGCRVLDLDEDEADRLFMPPGESVDDDFIYGWPENFAADYLNAQDDSTRAAVTAARIDHFIATKGKE